MSCRTSSLKTLLPFTTLVGRSLSTTALTLFEVILNSIVLSDTQVLHQSSRGMTTSDVVKTSEGDSDSCSLGVVLHCCGVCLVALIGNCLTVLEFWFSLTLLVGRHEFERHSGTGHTLWISEGPPITVCVYFHPNKKRRGSREGKCHDQTMMSTKVNERIKTNTQYVSLGRTWRKKYEGRRSKRCVTTRPWFLKQFIMNR